MNPRRRRIRRHARKARKIELWFRNEFLARYRKAYPVVCVSHCSEEERQAVIMSIKLNLLKITADPGW